MRKMIGRILLCLLFTTAAYSEEPAAVEPSKGEFSRFIEALVGGKPALDMRFRWENADIDGGTGLRGSDSLTIRTRLGYGTGTYHGFSAYGDFENIVAIDDDAYFDAIAPNSDGRTVIADPEESELNQAFLQWAGKREQLRGGFKAGRQRIIFDDARFIGNVGWRQNEQTFDSVRGDFGMGPLSLTYGYLFDVHRIFGDDGVRGAGTRDFESDSHIINASFNAVEWAKLTAFVYLLDFDNNVANATSFANSSNTYGFRAQGKVPVGEKFFFAYLGSYAYQEDGGENPTNYEAHYGWVEATLGHTSIGSVAVGWEVLGSDDGVAQFRTPLSTAHKFNGFADAFLDNGGPAGLEDLFITVAPKLPFGVKGKFVYHRFQSNDGGVDLGDEYNFVLSRGFFKHFSLLAKFAYYEGGSEGRPDRHRFTLDAGFKF